MTTNRKSRRRSIEVLIKQLGVMAVAAIIFLQHATLAPAQEKGILGKGTAWETTWFVQSSGKPGPTVFVVGGLHGNEAAGSVAADQIKGWPIVRGKIVVLPRANVVALNAASRNTPGADEEERNLNRNFPRKNKKEPARGDLAIAIWRLVEKHQPDWLLDLQEGYDFRQVNSKSVGSSIIVQPNDQANEAAARMLGAVNRTITDNKKQFVKLRYPVDSGLARAAAEQLGANSMTLETTTKKQSVSLRARQHRVMVHQCLVHLKMIDKSVHPDTGIELKSIDP